MKQGCIFLICVIVAAFFGYRALFEGTQFAPMWWVPLLLGIALALVVGNLQGIILALRHIGASKRTQSQWKDGDLVVLGGRIQTNRAALNAPISGKPAAVVEYEISKVIHSSSNKSNSSVADYRGCLMAPCSLHSMSGQVRLVGFPILAHWPNQRFYDPPSYERIAKYMLANEYTPMAKSPLAAIAELNKILSDDDGDVTANYRSPNAPDFKNSGTDILISSSSPEDDLSEEEREELGEEPIELTSDEPTARIINFLRNNAYTLSETMIPNGSEVTIMGTYKSQQRQVDIGSGLSRISHGIYSGKAETVLRNNLRKAVIMTVIFSAIFLAANYFILKEIGITPNTLISGAKDLTEKFNTGSEDAI